jgi:hypothetical protein
LDGSGGILRRFPFLVNAAPGTGSQTLIQHLMRDLAGYNFDAATGFLDSLAWFEEESPA